VTGQQQFTIENAAVAEETKHWKAVVKSKLEFFSAPAELVESLTESFPELGDKVYFSKEA
jgi:acid phosphatase class B